MLENNNEKMLLIDKKEPLIFPFSYFWRRGLGSINISSKCYGGGLKRQLPLETGLVDESAEAAAATDECK